MAKYPDIEHSSRVIPEDLPKDNRLHLTLANTKLSHPYNIRIKRFDPEQWLIDYNAMMVATNIPLGSRSFKVPAQWRSNSDFLGVRWQSADNFNHHYFKYEENKDYSGLILAFRANPTEPNKFTVTMTADGVPLTYRLAPYALDSKTGKYECLDKSYGTKRSYPASIIGSVEYAIPLDHMEEYAGTKDYIFILDFDDMRTQNSFSGPRISPTNISQISFDCVEASHGLGKDAYMSLMTQLPNNEIRMELGGVSTNAVLTAGDKIQAIWRWYAEGTNVQNYREDEFVVKSFTGFGTSALSVIVEGTMPGIFAGCDAFFGRYLATGVPAGVADTTKYFCDMTMTGGVQTIGKRHYPQIPNGQGMTSGFDDGYNLTPERQVKMTYDLGYRNWWTCYIGMSHYFSARTAFQHKVTGQLVTESKILSYPVLFAGQSNAAIHFMAGLSPKRGIDSFQRKLAELFGVNYGAFFPIDGATGSTAADRMCSPNPDSEVFDPLQLNGAGGLWWWNLETDLPGPAMMNCLAQLDGKIPRAIVWSQGEQDAAAIGFPGTRNPAPSLARSKLATQKIFAYFRSLWGETLPILIQEQGYGWSLVDPSNGALNIQSGMPTYLRAVRNSWGDLVFSFASFKENPVGKTYRLEIFHPQFSDQILRTLTVDGSNIINGMVTCDYPAELAVADIYSVYGYESPWSYIRWRVTRTDNGNVKSEITPSVVPLDDTAFVKQVAVFGLSALTGGYFTDQSDPLVITPQGAPGRKDRIAASTFRKELALKLGLRDVEVMPFNVSVGFSSMAPTPYIPNNIADNYWWDAVNNQPGPVLLAADSKIKALGMVPSYFIQSPGEESTGLRYVTDSAQKSEIVQTWKQSNIALLNWMRANWGNPDLDVWMQGATSTWFSPTTPPNQLTWEAAHLIRDAQVNLALNQEGFNIGSFVPNGGDYNSFRNEGGNWSNYTVATFHAVAKEMADSIGSGTDQAGSDPQWTDLRPPTNPVARRRVNDDILIKWDARPEALQFRLRNINVNSANLISNTTFTGKQYIYPVADQINAYNQKAYYVIANIGEYLPDTNVTGPEVRLEMQVEEADPTLATLNNLQVRYVGEAEEIPNGGGALKPRDILVTWDGPNDGVPFWVKNIRADVSLVPITSQKWTSNYFRFSIADQIAQYGYGATAVNIEISKYNEADQTRGPLLIRVARPDEPLKRESIA